MCPMNTKPLQIAYIVPVHNDENSLHHCFEQLNDNLKNLQGAFAVLVENGSRDKSFEVAQNMAKDSRIVAHVFTEKNAGIGYAYHRGMSEALKLWDGSTDLWLILTASDLPFGFSDLKGFLSWYKAHAPPHRLITNMAMGSKGNPNSVIRNPVSRKLMTGVYRAARRWMLGMKTKDSQGSVFIRASLAKELLPLVVSRNFFYSTELVYFAEKAGNVVEEIAVTVADEIRPSTVRPIKDGSKMFLQILELRKRQQKGQISPRTPA